MFVNRAKEIKWKNTKIKVLWPKEVEKEWLWLLWAVWKWSINKAQMIVLERIVDKKLPTIWIVWKWIVFDTGWLNLKPEKWMYPMKDDMCWAATVLTIMKELDKKDIKVNIIASIPLAENSVSWEAYRPSDILKAYNWKTVNVINTDAEWRLILADWISYISKNYKLDRVITVATLTWACLYALWFRYAWIMWDDREIIDSLLKYSKTNFEKYMELPFDNYYIEKTKSEIADYDNLREWIFAWSTMWGAFLYNFLLNKEKFTHIDIAWVANNSYEPYGLYSKSTTWFWVDSLSKLILSLK
jgi:leucyl aminopeptidase